MSPSLPNWRAGARLLACFVLSALPPTSAFADPGSDVGELLRRASGRSARFVQRFTPRGFKKETVESGSVVFGVPPQMHWTYVSPEKKEFVFDGDTSWLYVPADNMVSVHRLTAEERDRLPFFVLANPSRLDALFDISRSGRRTTLRARSKEALIPVIELDAGEGGLPSRLAYADGQGNRTVFEFLEFGPVVTPKPGVFRFEAPPGAEVVENR